MFEVWDKKSNINGFSPNEILERTRHLKNEDTIFINVNDGAVSQIEGKKALSSVYGIDYSLNDADFIAEYTRIRPEAQEEKSEDEATEEEEATE